MELYDGRESATTEKKQELTEKEEFNISFLNLDKRVVLAIF
jgi:hypothetical protein